MFLDNWNINSSPHFFASWNAFGFLTAILWRRILAPNNTRCTDYYKKRNLNLLSYFNCVSPSWEDLNKSGHLAVLELNLFSLLPVTKSCLMRYKGCGEQCSVLIPQIIVNSMQRCQHALNIVGDLTNLKIQWIDGKVFHLLK